MRKILGSIENSNENNLERSPKDDETSVDSDSESGGSNSNDSGDITESDEENVSEDEVDNDVFAENDETTGGLEEKLIPDSIPPAFTSQPLFSKERRGVGIASKPVAFKSILNSVSNSSASGGSDENVRTRSYNSENVSVDGSLKIKLKKGSVLSKNETPIEKRVMCYMANPSHIIGKDADNFSNLDENQIKKKVSRMNHSTRFWLAVKFCRLHKNDFETSTKIKKSHPQPKLCKILGIGYPSIAKYLNRLSEIDNIADLMKKNNYLSPVEFKPKFHEPFFKKYASNYVNLKVSGCFKSVN